MARSGAIGNSIVRVVDRVDDADEAVADGPSRPRTRPARPRTSASRRRHSRCACRALRFARARRASVRPARDRAAPSSRSGPTRRRARRAAGLRRSCPSRDSTSAGPPLTARPRARAAATRARRCRRGSRDRAPARSTGRHGHRTPESTSACIASGSSSSPRGESGSRATTARRSGGTTQLFMLTYTSSPNAASVAASGFSMMRSSHPSRAMTTANFWMRSGEIRPSASRPARLNAATAGPPCSTSARHDDDGIEVVAVDDEHVHPRR